MIPSAIRAIIMERPLLASENPDEYDDFFLFVVETYKPEEIDWFDVKKLCHLMWEEHRMNRLKPAILETAPVAEEAHSKETMLINQYKGLAAEYPDKYNKKMVQQAIKGAKVPARIIDAKAFVERLPELETMEKLQLSNEAQQRVFRQQLADRNTIQPSPKKANNNDNEDEPHKKLAHDQGKDETPDAESRKKASSDEQVEDQETTPAQEADDEAA
ncbi:MAG: hypothetical protein P8Y71_17990 [Pseudolabrys sp.]